MLEISTLPTWLAICLLPDRTSTRILSVSETTCKSPIATCSVAEVDATSAAAAAHNGPASPTPSPGPGSAPCTAGELSFDETSGTEVKKYNVIYLTLTLFKV